MTGDEFTEGINHIWMDDVGLGFDLDYPFVFIFSKMNAGKCNINISSIFHIKC